MYTFLRRALDCRRHAQHLTRFSSDNSDAWITNWTSRKYASAGYTSDAFYAGIYGLLVIVFLAMSFARAFIYYHVGKLGANTVHDTAFDAALKAPMHFFHVTPIGNLLAFFSKDTEVIDDMLVDNMLMYQVRWLLVDGTGMHSSSAQR